MSHRLRASSARLLGRALVGASTTLAAACSGTKEEPVQTILATSGCADSQGQALTAPPSRFDGTSLAPKQLALTFDDGPGTNTIALSAWLSARGIKATFFVTGSNTAGRPNALAAVAADGHLLANHTQNHRDLRSTAQFPLNAAGEAALVAELAQTDALVAPYVENDRFLFRAPYGYFESRAYNVLHASAMDKYVGHVHWDVGSERVGSYAADWACWENDPKLTSKQCGDLYINEIDARGRGIVLMHDADKGPGVGNHNPTSGVGNTMDMVKYMVPLLEAAGYAFVRADDVPAISAALPPLPPPPPPLDAGVDASGSDSGPADAGAPSDASSDASAPKEAGATSTPPSSAPPSAAPGPSTPSDPCARAAAARARSR